MRKTRTTAPNEGRAAESDVNPASAGHSPQAPPNADNASPLLGGPSSISGPMRVHGQLTELKKEIQEREGVVEAF